MSDIKGHRLYVMLGASQTRRRIKGVGLGVRRVESVDRNQSVIIHTATGEHLRRLKSLLADVLPPDPDRPPESRESDKDQPPPDV